MQTNQKGYRGYVFSRSVDSHRVPQHIQNLVIRDYAARRKLPLRRRTAPIPTRMC